MECVICSLKGIVGLAVMSRCRMCSGSTPSSAQKLCHACSAREKRCVYCCEVIEMDLTKIKSQVLHALDEQIGLYEHLGPEYTHNMRKLRTVIEEEKVTTYDQFCEEMKNPVIDAEVLDNVPPKETEKKNTHPPVDEGVKNASCVTDHEVNIIVPIAIVVVAVAVLSAIDWLLS